MAEAPAIDELDRKYAAAKRLRQQFEPQWYVDLAFYTGRQWVTFDGYMLADIVLDDLGEQVIDNRIQPIVRTEIAKMTKTRPVFIGVPKSGDDSDRAAARLAESLLEYQWKHLGMLRKLRAALLWSRVCGAGFLKVTWDSEMGDGTDILVDAAGKPIKDSYGAPMRPDRLEALPEGYAEQNGISSRRVAMGDLRVDVRTPFEMYVDPLCGEDGLDDAEWIIEEAVYSKRYVYEHYPLAAKMAIEPDSDSIAGIAESRMPGVVNAAGGEPQGICLREYWCRPTASEPKGRHIVWTKNGQVLLDEDNPYPWLPYVMFRGVPVPGRFWPSSVTEQLISPQTELNKRKSQIAENAQRVGNPPLMKSSINADFDWQGLPGEVLDFQDTGSPGAIPQFLNVPEVPGYIREDIDRIEQSIREISGQHEVTSGAVPAGVTAASAINLLQEADDTRLGPDIADMENALAGLGQRIVYLIARFYTDQRVIRVAGTDGRWEFVAYRKGMLPDDQGVEVQAGSGLPQSKAAKQAAIQEVLNMLVQSQVKLSEQDLRQVMQEYEVGGLEKFFATIGEDEREVARENQTLATGQMLDISEWQDDDVHLAGHNRFRKTAAYWELPDQARGVFDAHCTLHEQRIADRARQAALAAMPPAAPMPPAGPGAPVMDPAGLMAAMGSSGPTG